ncbi:hypothetical protein P4H83_32240 [Paenibacillus favisporus]|uniref:DUF7507 domain-containing protein n=1 Tax=Paenibacillus favisporus TaxID=221028 RepID=UPI002DC00E9E|nr:hypothetical protein [Paenibacillus favisporus]MEC0179552.1 hypothetical protein [Paenibacillus favisporus]
MPLNLRFVDNQPGAITFTGNTLGLGRSGTVGVPGTVDAIGAFTTIDTSLQFSSFPPGTTDDFNLNSSSAVLRIPPGSNVLYAELVWSGNFQNSSSNLSAFIDKSVNLITPQGILHEIPPDPSTATNLTIIAGVSSYVRSANITSIIQESGAGVYTAGGIVGILTLPDSSTDYCGWTLGVVYEHSGLPFRNLSLYAGGVVVNQNTTVTTPITGFGTPVTGPVSGRLAISAGDGDANTTGDQVLFGPNSGSLAILQGPNNFPNNFFASQINDDNGFLDTSGTFGTRNQINGSPGTNVVGGRQGWDITNVDVSSTLVNNQTQAAVQFRTSSDAYIVTAFGLQIDLNAPKIDITKDVDAPTAVLGQILTYTVFLTNTGTAEADFATLIDNIPEGTLFVEDSVFLDGSPLPGVNPADGIPLGNLLIGQTRILTFQVKVVSRPPGDVIINEAAIKFEYQIVAGGPFESGTVISNPVIIPFLAAELTINKTAFPSAVFPGEVVHYTFTVSNPGNVPLTNIIIDDPVLGFHQITSSLDPGTAAEYFFDFVVPPGIPAGTVFRNVVTAVSNEAGPVSAEADVTVLASYNVQITKTPDRFSVNPNETVNYTLTVTNLSNAPITNVVVEDSLTGFSTIVPFMSEGESRTFIISFTVPPEALAGSVITNVATAVPAETGPVFATAAIIVSTITALFVFKTVDHPTAAPGETVHYTITVTNAGNAPLTNVRITDPLLGVDQIFDALPPGDTIQIDAPFVIPPTASEGDIIHNVVTATSDQVGPETANADVIVTGASAIALTKTVSPTEASPGSPVTYTFVVTNIGHTTLTDVLLSDPLLDISQDIGTLAIGESRTVTLPFIIPPGASTDFVNTANVIGHFGPVEVTAEASASVALILPSFTLTKTVDPTEAFPREEVFFTYTLTNTGNVPLTNIALSDPLLAFTSTIPTLAPGASTSGSIPFVIPVDAAAGATFTNVLTAAPLETAAQSASATVTALGDPAITLTKTSSVTSAAPGETVTYTITVTNTGNMDLISVGVGDELLGLNEVIPVLAPGQSETFTPAFVIPPGTPDGTIITNISTATSDQTESIEAIARVIVNAPAFTMSVTKTANPTSVAPGQTVQYTITVTNTSAGSLTNVTLIDDLLGIFETLGTLAPGESRTLGFNFTVPEGTLAGTTLINTTVANSDETDPVQASAAVTVAAAPGLQLDKAIEPPEAKPGQTVQVILTLRNTGNTDLTHIVLNDPQLGFELLVPSLPAGTLQIVNYPFIVPEVPAGTVIVDTVTATSDQTGETTASDSLTVLPAFSASVTKTVDRTTAVPGETVTFTITFQNLSNAPLTNLVLSDALLEMEAFFNEVPAGFFTTITRSFTVPQGTLGGTTLLNTAVFESPEIGEIEAEAAVTAAGVPQFELKKMVQPQSALPGQTVIFHLNVTNTGNVPLQNVHISDPLLGIQGTLMLQAPEETESLIVLFTVPATAAAGEKIINTLQVSAPGVSPRTASAILNVIAPSITILKETSTTQAFVQDEFHFTLLVTNNGNLPAVNIVLTDPLQEGIQFLLGSVTIDGISSPRANPETGILLANLGPGQVTKVVFKVKAISVPPMRKVSNLAQASFRPEGSAQTFQVSSNLVVIHIHEHEE